jgi:thiamine kinase-like enzyme
LKTSTGLHFVDFEYAGWDDPAKLICDFYNQPRIPAGLANLAHELPLWADACGWTATSLNERVRFLSPLYVIKWCCILMNEFLPDGAKRRIFSGEEDISERKIVQLQQAQKRLDSLHEFKWRACD